MLSDEHDKDFSSVGNNIVDVESQDGGHAWRFKKDDDVISISRYAEHKWHTHGKLLQLPGGVWLASSGLDVELIRRALSSCDQKDTFLVLGEEDAGIFVCLETYESLISTYGLTRRAEELERKGKVVLLGFDDITATAKFIEIDTTSLPYRLTYIKSMAELRKRDWTFDWEDKPTLEIDERKLKTHRGT